MPHVFARIRVEHVQRGRDSAEQKRRQRWCGSDGKKGSAAPQGIVDTARRRREQAAAVRHLFLRIVQDRMWAESQLASSDA